MRNFGDMDLDQQGEWLAARGLTWVQWETLAELARSDASVFADDAARALLVLAEEVNLGNTGCDAAIDRLHAFAPSQAWAASGRRQRADEVRRIEEAGGLRLEWARALDAERESRSRDA